MKPTISIALITLGVTLPVPALADQWERVPGSYFHGSGSDCHVEVNTTTVKRLHNRVMWEERLVCSGGLLKNGPPFVGYATCSGNGKGVLLANDGNFAEWVKFSVAQLTPHRWGMGNLGYRVACRQTH